MNSPCEVLLANFRFPDRARQANCAQQNWFSLHLLLSKKWQLNCWQSTSWTRVFFADFPKNWPRWHSHRVVRYSRHRQIFLWKGFLRQPVHVRSSSVNHHAGNARHHRFHRLRSEWWPVDLGTNSWSWSLAVSCARLLNLPISGSFGNHSFIWKMQNPRRNVSAALVSVAYKQM